MSPQIDNTMSKTLVCLYYPPLVYDKSFVLVTEPNTDSLDKSVHEQQLTEEFLERMSGIGVNHPDYNTIFHMLFCHNGFYYSRKVFDILKLECLNAGMVPFSCSKTRFWFYHRINRLVQKEIEGHEIKSVELNIRCAPSQL